jgi:mannose-1-phosphate guanylyltransferase
MGIRPTHPATGYGYIERAAVAIDEQGTAFAVESFREKPARDLARQFLEAGTYFWNAGIFLWRADGVLKLLQDFQPEIHKRLMRLRDAVGTPRWDSDLQIEFPGMPSVSIDYGVLEPMAALRDRDKPVFVVPASFEWDDVGSWEALPRVMGADPEGNTISGPQCGIETEGCVIRTTPDHLVATFGISNLIVVHTAEATLVAPRDDESAIRRLVALLEERGYGRFL